MPEPLNPFNSDPESLKSPESPKSNEDYYFQAIFRLNQLRDQVRSKAGFSAYDLIQTLDGIVSQSSFDPVGARYQHKTPDEFFSANPTFQQLEADLASKICSANVSEVLALVKTACYYTPTRRVVRVLETVYRQILEADHYTSESG